MSGPQDMWCERWEGSLDKLQPQNGLGGSELGQDRPAGLRRKTSLLPVMKHSHASISGPMPTLAPHRSSQEVYRGPCLGAGPLGPDVLAVDHREARHDGRDPCARAAVSSSVSTLSSPPSGLPGRLPPLLGRPGHAGGGWAHQVCRERRSGSSRCRLRPRLADLVVG